MAEITKKDIFDTLNEFYGRMIGPELGAIRNKLDEHDQRFRDILEHFDKIYTRLDRLETEYYSIVAGIDRVEKRLDHVDGRLDKIEIRLDTIDQKLDKEISVRQMIEKEIRDLKQRVAALQERIEDLEKRL
jgi:chromosome segregation ATPase